MKRLILLFTALCILCGILSGCGSKKKPSGFSGNLHVDSISVETLPDKMNYVVGDWLNTDGLEIRLNLSGGRTTVVTDGFTISPSDLKNEGEQVITIKYFDCETTFTVNVSPDTNIYDTSALSDGQIEEEPEEDEWIDCSEYLKNDVMTYEEYCGKEDGDIVVIETYVQEKRQYKDGITQMFVQNKDCGLMIESVRCTQEEYDQLERGTKVKLAGVKKGDMEYGRNILNASLEIIGGEPYFAKALVITDSYNFDAEKYRYRLVEITDLWIQDCASSPMDDPENHQTCKYNDFSESSDIRLYVHHTPHAKYELELYVLSDISKDLFEMANELEIGNRIRIEGIIIESWDELCILVTDITEY